MPDLIEVGLAAAKAFAIVMFAMNLAVLLTWADRRQGAAIQDRVGPNRAVAWIPTKVAMALAVLPALLVAAALPAWVKFNPELRSESIGMSSLLVSQLAIFMVWFTALVIAGKVRGRGAQNSFDAFLAGFGDPRRIFYAGVAAHVVTLALGVFFRRTAIGDALAQLGLYGGAAVFAFAVLFGAGYSAYGMRNEPRVGLRLYGLLHPAADGLKTLFKEDFIPPKADRFLHSLAPLISFFPALVVLGVVPFGDTLCFGVDQDGSKILTELLPYVPKEGVCSEGALPLGVFDLNVGVLYFFALAGTGIVGAALAGWASDNKFSLLGGLRAASQMVSYEVTMGLTLIGAFMIYGTLQVDDMIRWQADNAWGVFVQPLAFVMFFAAAVAESKRIPFDLPEGESEIVAGYYTEYAGMKFAMFFFAEYIAVVTSSALMAAIFLGGWHLPFINRAGIEIAIGGQVYLSQALPHALVVVIGLIGFILKTIVLCWLQLTIRWTLPRFRYDQLMKLGWRKLLPASLVNILATGMLILLVQEGGPALARGMDTAADVTMVVIAVVGIWAVVQLVLFILKPARKRRLLATSSAQFAAAMGGTRTSRMQA
jgi:NADH-quinone oxidoreductase subunit H